MTGCAHAHDEVVSAAWFQFESLVEGSYTVDFHEGHAESLGGGPHGLFGYVAVVLLNVLKHLDELIRLTATPFQYLVETLGHDSHPLDTSDILIIFRICDTINNLNTE
jgi:uncharacterized protein (UPF0371 family)